MKTAVLVMVSLSAAIGAQTVAYFEVPRVGRVLHRQAMRALSDVRDARLEVAGLNAEIQAARIAYWEQYPNGVRLAAAEQNYAAALWRKDLYYMLHRTAVGLGSRPEPLFGGNDAYGRTLEVMTGQVDGGIHPMADRYFERWRTRAAALMLSNPAGLEDTWEEYAQYLLWRDRAEYFAGPKSPLQSRDARVFLTGLLMRAVEVPISFKEADAQYRALSALLGESVALDTAKRVMATPAGSDSFHISDDWNLADEFDARLPRDPRILAIFYLRPWPRADDTEADGWGARWLAAEQQYEALVAARGVQHVHAAAALVAAAPTRVSDGRVVLIDGSALGCPSELPSSCFTSLANAESLASAAQDVSSFAVGQVLPHVPAAMARQIQDAVAVVERLTTRKREMWEATQMSERGQQPPARSYSVMDVMREENTYLGLRQAILRPYANACSSGEARAELATGSLTVCQIQAVLQRLLPERVPWPDQIGRTP